MPQPCSSRPAQALMQAAALAEGQVSVKASKAGKHKRAATQLGATWQPTDTSSVAHETTVLDGCIFHFLSYGALTRAQAERLVVQHGGKVRPRS